MKKFFALIFVLCLSLICLGCGGETPDPDPDPNPNQPEQPEVVTYKVEFLVDGNVVDTQEVEKGKAATKPADPVKDGYTFKGWDKDFSNITADLKVNAEFEKIIVKYTVKFLVDGKVVETQEVEEGKAATKPADPKKDGFVFKGWDKEYNNITADLEVNAVFEEDKVYHTVEFLVDGAVYATVQVEDGKAAELPEQPTKEGEYFAGWLKDTSCVTSDMSVRAKFVEVNLEAKTVMGLQQIGKAPFTMFWVGSGIDSNADLYNKHIFVSEGVAGNLWWYQICISNINGQLTVVEVSPRGQTATTKVCDWSIVCYPDSLAAVLSATGVQVGDVIEFTKQPGSFGEKTECDELFRVKRPGEITQYLLDSDTAHTVVALHKIGKYFESLGEKVSVDKIELTTLEDGSDGTNPTDAVITWTSSNPEIVATDGTINLPDEETEVTLTAVATYGTSTYKQTFTIKVGK